MQYTASDLPLTIPSGTAGSTSGQSTPGSVSSSIVVPDNFIIAGDKTAAGLSVMQVRLDLAYPDDPNLTATLYHYSATGTLMGEVTLFGGVGSGNHTANFDQTVFDDNAPTPIQEGRAPFSAIYNPQESLATVFAPTGNGQDGMTVQGTWTLVVQNNATGGTTGTLNGWSLTFQKPLPTSGLGVPGSDNASGQLPALHPGHDRRPVEPGVDVGRRGLDHRRGRPGQRDRRRSLRPLGQHGLRRRRQRRHLEDDRLPDDQPRRADLDPADRTSAPPPPSTSAASPSSPGMRIRTSRSSSPPPAAATAASSPRTHQASAS